MKKNNRFKFVDLFCGIGGFHIAMTNLGGECILASEIDEFAKETYKINHNINTFYDATEINPSKIDNFDVLCAGFPCQPFSKAGSQLGFTDKIKGTLFFDIVRILKESRPNYFILENVRNLVSHDKGNTYKVIIETLNEIGYVTNKDPIIMSPHQLKVPQLRDRVYIIGRKKEFNQDEIVIKLPNKEKTNKTVYDYGIIETSNVEKKYNISQHEERVLNIWNEFYLGVKEDTIGFPVWSSDFKQSYDLSELPSWKAEIIKKNRNLYANNKSFIDDWLKKHNGLDGFTPTEKKFEWQAGSSINSIWEGLIQFRPSGIRVKKPDYFPALVAMVQIPILGKYKRRLTPKEASRLQSFPESFVPNPNDKQAYKQFGNAVNAVCVEYLAKQIL
jgi:DNA (cytosine-5)-methyltransferase 1